VPRYFFIIQRGARVHDDPDGTALPNEAAARDYAARVIGELKAAGGYDEPGLTMVVKSATGRTLFTIPFLGA
jgi:Domain of unknown function (DUF6894)